MSGRSSNSTRETARGEWFGHTSWTTVYAARDADMPERKEALEQLCRTYWYPLYAYARRCGHRPEDAEDLTQSFFHHLLERNFLGAIDRRKGKFRSFLLASLKYFLENERQYRGALKRGGGKVILSLDQCLEDRFAHEPASEEIPELRFDRDWASALLDRARARLKNDYRADGKIKLFIELETFLTQESSMRDYETIAPRLRMSANAVAIATHRLRHKYRDLLREEIGRTVAGPEETDREMQHLFEIMGKAGL